jgi:hypothetical protein
MPGLKGKGYRPDEVSEEHSEKKEFTERRGTDRATRIRLKGRDRGLQGAEVKICKLYE